MHPTAHGIDLVEIDRIDEMLDRHGARFLDRCFTVREQGYAEGGKRLRGERLAARFAAKEAVLKALGTGLRGGIAWTDIEVIRDQFGAPSIELSGAALAAARERGIGSWLVSLTHVREFAMASVVGVAGEPTSGA